MTSHFSAVFIGKQIDSRPLVLMLDYEYQGRRQWKAPGGVSDRGESPEQTGVREVHEETGLVVPPDALTRLLVRPSSLDHSQYFFASTEFSGSLRTHLLVDDKGEELHPPSWSEVDASTVRRVFDSHRDAFRLALDHFGREWPAFRWVTEAMHARRELPSEPEGWPRTL